MTGQGQKQEDPRGISETDTTITILISECGNLWTKMDGKLGIKQEIPGFVEYQNRMRTTMHKDDNVGLHFTGSNLVMAGKTGWMGNGRWMDGWMRGFLALANSLP